MIEYKVNIEGISPDMLDGFFDGWPNPPSPEKHLQLYRRTGSWVSLQFSLSKRGGQLIGHRNS